MIIGVLKLKPAAISRLSTRNCQRNANEHETTTKVERFHKRKEKRMSTISENIITRIFHSKKKELVREKWFGKINSILKIT